MARLIDADELKKEITSAFHGALGVTITIAMHELIDKQPTIDHESLRPRAHWIRKRSKFPGGELTVVECSLCGCQQWNETNFCPICGAKMED